MVVRGMSLAHSFPVAIVEKPVAFNQDLKAFAPNPAVESEFILRWLQANQSKLLLLATEASHGTKRIPTGDLLASHVSLPQHTEQREIARALSDMDRLFDAVEALIAKKRAIKLAAIQQLLTGKARLTGQLRRWGTNRLSDMGYCIRGVSYDPTTDLSSSDRIDTVRLLRSHNIQDDTVMLENIQYVDSRKVSEPQLLRIRDILICMENGSKDLVGKAGIFDTCDGYSYTFGAFMGCFRVDQSCADADFVSYLFQTHEFRRHIGAVLAGSSINNLKPTDIESFEFHGPDKDEQFAIASTLSDMDGEIIALERHRDKVRGLRQGMLHQLVTGDVRLANAGEAKEQGEVTDASERRHNWQFNEAVVISVLARNFGTERYPLGRMRYIKLLYLLHRHNEDRTDGYLKKAAGPYNPRIRYGGPERISLEKGYIRRHKNKDYQGFVADSHVGEAEEYFDKWYGKEAIQWLEQFRYKKNDELELLTTVDMAAEELRAADKEVSVEYVKNVILDHREWRAKMGRRIFADANLTSALDDSRTLFAVSGELDTP